MSDLSDQGMDANGLQFDRPNAISTWTRRYIEPLHPKPEDVSILDIAHALSRLCRYNGHVAGFLSVARHSIWVADHLRDQGLDEAVQLQGLLHDGAETYLSDIPRPIKHAPEMEFFRGFDSKMDEAVMLAFDLPYPIADVVMAADKHVLLEVELPRPHGARHTWTSLPEEDEVDFLARFNELRYPGTDILEVDEGPGGGWHFLVGRDTLT